jgi:uncharacterized protein (TIGR02996 family)
LLNRAAVITLASELIAPPGVAGMASSLSRNNASIPPEVRMFFRDIKEHPDDDTPRLIFADWLQEHGDAATAARGEFLRLQVLRHRLSPDDPNYGLLKRREGELFTEYRWTWLGALVDAARTWTFERGMVQVAAQAEKLLMPEVAVWARSEAALWIDALTLSEIRFGNRGEAKNHIDGLASSPLLAHLNKLDMSNNGGLNCLDLVFRAFDARNLPFLTQLFLSHNRWAASYIVSLSLCSHCRQLRVLDLQHNRLYDDAARTLAVSPCLRSDVILYLGHNRFTADGIALLREAYGERVRF